MSEKVIQKGPTVAPRKMINILLLGETGVGKSTFINAFANYLAFDTIDEAKNGQIQCLIPCSFTLTDDNYEEKVIKLNEDKNEKFAPGESATQQCKAFLFPFSGYTVRLIDTPGVGDTRGVKQDNWNFDNILTYIGKFKEVHCICILLKPNNARLTVTFEYCVKQLLTHLQKSASRNIVFLFTNTRSTFYRPGDTAPPLKRILDEVKESHPHVQIPFNKSTVYCMDNEAFRFLVAMKQGIKFPDNESKNFADSWVTSMKECRRLMTYIIGTEDGHPGLEPHQIQDTVSVNEARRIILALTQPLAEITQNIDDNLKVMDRHREQIEKHSNTMKQLENNLYIPTIELELIDLDRPRTVCSAVKCVSTYSVAGMTKIIYKQVCCDPCDLAKVTKDVLGDPGLKDCTAMDENGNCTQCLCSYDKHLHVYYETNIIEGKLVDEKVNKDLINEGNAKVRAAQILEDIKNRSDKMRYEMRTIMMATPKFAHFLKNNAIIPHNDAFKDYLDTLLENRKTTPGAQMDKTLDDMLKEYNDLKKILDETDVNKAIESAVSADDVLKSIDKLYSLPLYGQKIKESQEKQKKARNAEITVNSVVHKAPVGTVARFTGWLKKLWN